MRVARDYGIDLRVYTFDQNGEVENGELQFRLKATDRLKLVSRGQMIAVGVERADLQTWLHEPMPVVLVVYDASAEAAYWLYVQEYFAQQSQLHPSHRSKNVTIRIPRINVLNPDAVRGLARCRDRVIGQIQGKVGHE